MAGGFAGGSTVNKIRGGRWTVVKFFALGVSYTIVWMAICSEMGFYRNLFGPSVLLQMNIMYFLPSIPLLIISSWLDDIMDHRFGVPGTLLIRLLIGVAGCATVATVFPFEQQRLGAVLWTVVALGMVHGISFSASYQLVARFAGKNTISLGLGCVGSGGIVLLLELGLGLNAHPSHFQNMVLYLICAGFVVLGLLAAMSLLVRHWNSIESTVEGSPAGGGPISQPLLEAPGGLQHAASLEGYGAGAGPLRRAPSNLLLALSPLDHFQTVSEGEMTLLLEQTDMWTEWTSRRWPIEQEGSWHRGPATLPVLLPSGNANAHSASLPEVPFERKSEAGILQSGAASSLLGVRESAAGTSPLESKASALQSDHAGMLAEVLQQIWPAQLALFLTGTCGLLIFPFLTYVPSDGMLGDMLPKTLFFVRLGADLVGRTIPRMPGCAMKSQGRLLAASAASVGASPLFFMYLKSPKQLHSDWLAIGFIAYLWLLNGAVNSNSYILVPTLVSNRQKATAAGMLAMTYQCAHVIGLLIGVVIVFLMFNGFNST